MKGTDHALLRRQFLPNHGLPSYAEDPTTVYCPSDTGATGFGFSSSRIAPGFLAPVPPLPWRSGTSRLRERIFDGEGFDPLSVLQVFAVESGAARVESRRDDKRIVETVTVARLDVERTVV